MGGVWGVSYLFQLPLSWLSRTITTWGRWMLRFSDPASHGRLELHISRIQAFVSRHSHPQITGKDLVFPLLCSLFPTWQSSGMIFFFFSKALTTIWYNISSKASSSPNMLPKKAWESHSYCR